jgi:hypothetical protein
MIDNMVVQVYAETAHTGVVKIGGWDTSALADGNLWMLKTANQHSWALMSNLITFDTT